MRDGLLALALVGLVASGAQAKERVTLELFIMSKCPFGVRVMSDLQPVLRALGDSLEFRLDFIGSEKDGQLTALHGESEVMGDKIEICAAKHHPDRFMDLIVCMNEKYRDIPEGWEQCANRSGVSIETVGACAQGDEGEELLRASFQRAQAKQVVGSPTILINGEPYRGNRSDTAFMQAVCGAFRRGRPEVCANIPRPVQVPVIILTDGRCAQCRPEFWERTIQGMFPGARIKQVDYTRREGKRLYQKIGPVKLPAVLLGRVVEQDDSFPRIRSRLTPKGEYFLMATYGQWDPTREICDNNADDDGNRLKDCQDPACAHDLACRKEESKKLEVFIMSQCPFAVRGLDAMKDVLQQFERDIRFEIHFIAEEQGDGFKALHGQPEVDENIRELCAIKYYPDNYKFLEYIWCRNQDIRSPDWLPCTGENGIDAKLIDLCFNGGEGKDLLRADIRIAEALQIRGSPTWVVNGRYKFNGIDANVIIEKFCERNADFWGCRPAGGEQP